jgi:hypothetical protein
MARSRLGESEREREREQEQEPGAGAGLALELSQRVRGAGTGRGWAPAPQEDMRPTAQDRRRAPRVRTAMRDEHGHTRQTRTATHHATRAPDTNHASTHAVYRHAGETPMTHVHTRHPDTRIIHIISPPSRPLLQRFHKSAASRCVATEPCRRESTATLVEHYAAAPPPAARRPPARRCCAARRRARGGGPAPPSTSPHSE